MKRLYGSTKGLKAARVHRLEKLYNRKIPPEYILTSELARDLSRMSHEIRRQIGLLINRRGRVVGVMIGDRQRIVIPDISGYRAAPGRLNGMRCVHTHLNGETLTQDDLTDLALLRLDLMAAVTVNKNGGPERIHAAHILPGGAAEKPYHLLEPLRPDSMDIGCLDLIQALEAELSQKPALRVAGNGRERALLVSVTQQPRRIARDSMEELRELARTCGADVIGTVIQQKATPDPRYLMGIGKLKELIIAALHKGATMVVFDQELNPSQIRSITDLMELKVIDRTQLILDIFARRAQAREGKLQVELAQLRYLLPRLVTRNTAMSRLTGGIGGRGPGETKLEIHRRRARDRIRKLEGELEEVRKQRKQQKAKRDKRGLPVISIVGYTNAGKSTLLNTLTRSRVFVENQLFATLDPSSRRLRFPRDIEVIITDTVGFIKDLPRDLMVAFRATLEELENADLLLHVIDISNPRFKEQVRSVEAVIEDLALTDIPVIRVLNKMDRVPAEEAARMREIFNAVPVCALDAKTLMPLIEKMQSVVEQIRPVS